VRELAVLPRPPSWIGGGHRNGEVVGREERGVNRGEKKFRKKRGWVEDRGVSKLGRVPYCSPAKF